jgi:hypothetical protein
MDNQQIAREGLGLLIPGQSQTVETRHRFTTPGPHVITARLTGADEISGDDRADHVVMVRQIVRVVLVDGNPAGSFFERAAGHTALALAPATDLLRGKQAGKDFLMDPVVIPAPEITAEKLATADVIVLADVARLPAGIASAVADRTAAGAGLLILAGPRSDAGFYNAWDGPDGPLSALELGAETTTEKGVSPNPETFRHAALTWATDERRSDLGGAVIRRWRQTTLRPNAGSLAAAFQNGDAFLATRSYGRGRSAVASCAFDARAGNLPGRAAFVPLVHELVAWLAGGGIKLNVEPTWSPSVLLDSRSLGGLSGRYFKREWNGTKLLMERSDPVLDFTWLQEPPAPKLPRDNFSVEWRASLVPPITGDYSFEAEVDDRLTFKLAGKTVLEQANQQAKQVGRARLEAGKPVACEVLYQEDGGEAFVRVFWTPPGGVRQLIPSSAWIPASTEKPPVFTALDPLGRPRKATVTVGRRGRELGLDGPAVPGLYQVKLPPEIYESVTGTTGPGDLPLVVSGEIAESRMEALTPDDLGQLRARAEVIQPQSLGDVLAVLSGRGFGREITRTLAVAAVLLLLLEAALARWVSRSRRAGDDLRIDFGDTAADGFEKGGWR